MNWQILTSAVPLAGISARPGGLCWSHLLPMIAGDGLLVAQSDQGRISELGKQFREGGGAGLDTTYLVVLIVAVVAMIVIVGVLAHFLGLREAIGLNRPRALMTELCRGHELDQVSRRLLRSLATWHRLAQPARLFVEPQWFDAASLSEPLRMRQAELERLRDRLFGRRL
jgi:hypothetical protein